jgi:hypothetical protein
MKIGEVAKAVTAGLVSFGGAFDVASSVGSVGGETVTTNEWVRIAIVTVVAAVAVWLIPNTPPEPAGDAGDHRA